MGSMQSNTLLTSEVAVTGVILIAGAYFFASSSKQANAPGSAQAGTGKQSAKNKRKRDNSKKTRVDVEAGSSNVASSVDTLVAEEPQRQAAGSAKVSAVTMLQER